MTRRRIVLELGENTTETHCGNCEHVSYARSVWLVGGAAYQAYECRLTGESLEPGPAPIRTDDCRAAEVKEVGDAE